MLTVSTKYSRIPSDAIKLFWYKSARASWKEVVLLHPDWLAYLRLALRKKATDFLVSVLCIALLTDHIHILLDLRKYRSEDEIKKIADQIKWYSSYMYHRHMYWVQSWSWRKHVLRSEWYSLTHLRSQDHLRRAIEYVNNNHKKHADIWGSEYLKQFMHESDRHK